MRIPNLGLTVMVLIGAGIMDKGAAGMGPDEFVTGYPNSTKQAEQFIGYCTYLISPFA